MIREHRLQFKWQSGVVIIQKPTELTGTIDQPKEIILHPSVCKL